MPMAHVLATYHAPMAAMQQDKHVAQKPVKMAVTSAANVYVPKIVPMAVMQAANNAVMKNVKMAANWMAHARAQKNA